MSDKVPLKSEIFKITQAQDETLEDLSKRVVAVEKLVDKQDTRNLNIVYGVLVAAVLVIVAVAVQIILTNSQDKKASDKFYEQINNQNSKYLQQENEFNLKNKELQNNLEMLRAKNPYLK